MPAPPLAFSQYQHTSRCATTVKLHWHVSLCPTRGSEKRLKGMSSSSTEICSCNRRILVKKGPRKNESTYSNFSELESSQSPRIPKLLQEGCLQLLRSKGILNGQNLYHLLCPKLPRQSSTLPGQTTIVATVVPQRRTTWDEQHHDAFIVSMTTRQDPLRSL